MFKLISNNLIIYGSTNIIKSFIPFLLLPILTTYLSQTEFGILSLIEVAILFLFPIISLNIKGAINVEFFNLKLNELKYFITNSLFLSFIVFLFVLIIFLFFSNFIVQISGIPQNIITYLPIFAFLRVNSQVLLGIFQMSQNPKNYALFTIFQSILDFLMTYVLVVIYNQSYLGRLGGIYFSFFISSIITIVYLYKSDYLSFPIFKYTKNILNFGIPLIPHALGGTIIALSDRFFISYYHSYYEVGIYSVAYQVSSIMLIIGISLNQGWVPIFYKLMKNKKNIKLIINYIIYLSIFLIITFLLILFFKEFIYKIFVNEKFYISKEYFILLAVGFLFQSLYFLIANFIFYLKKTTYLAIITCSCAIINIILNYILIQMNGVVGVALATLITWGLFLIIILIVTYFLVKNENS
jgi:O-antigen/teichoic acid export membrane protein